MRQVVPELTPAAATPCGSGRVRPPTPRLLKASKRQQGASEAPSALPGRTEHIPACAATRSASVSFATNKRAPASEPSAFGMKKDASGTPVSNATLSMSAVEQPAAKTTYHCWSSSLSPLARSRCQSRRVHVRGARPATTRVSSTLFVSAPTRSSLCACPDCCSSRPSACRHLESSARVRLAVAAKAMLQPVSTSSARRKQRDPLLSITSGNAPSSRTRLEINSGKMAKSSCKSK